MNYTSVWNFRKNLAQYLDLVENKQEQVVINKRGEPIAVVTAYKKGGSDFGRYFGMFPGNETGEQRLERVRRSAAEKTGVKRYAR